MSDQRWLIEVTTRAGFVATARYNTLARYAEFRDAVERTLAPGSYDRPIYRLVTATRLRREA